MKILSGALRGRVIPFRANPYLRPTADKVRKAIFDILQGQLAGKKVLDLFSGTGALGFEALSGGACTVTFVEQSAVGVRRIKEGAASFGLEHKVRVLGMSFQAALKKLSKEEERFDLVFLDPPYEKGLAEKALSLLSLTGLMRDGGLVILECNKRENFPTAPGNLHGLKTKLYGDTKVVVYRSAQRRAGDD